MCVEMLMGQRSLQLCPLFQSAPGNVFFLFCCFFFSYTQKSNTNDIGIQAHTRVLNVYGALMDLHDGSPEAEKELLEKCLFLTTELFSIRELKCGRVPSRERL